MAVPAEDARDVVPGHGAETRHDVLDVASEQVPVVGHAVCERRAVVEDVLLAILALLKRGLERAVGAPVIQHDALHVREAVAAARHVNLWVDVANHGYSSFSRAGTQCCAVPPCLGHTPPLHCGEGSVVFRMRRPGLIGAVAVLPETLPGDGRINACYE